MPYIFLSKNVDISFKVWYNKSNEKGMVRKIKINVIISKIVYTSDRQSVYGAYPQEGLDYDKIIINPIFKNITLVSTSSGLQLGSEYELEVEEIFDKKYGRQYCVVSIPMFDDVDFSNITYDESLQLLKSCTSERLSLELLRVYPNAIDLIVNNKLDQIDTNKLKGIKQTRLNQIEKNLKASCKWKIIQQHCEEYKLTEQECDTLDKTYNDKELIRKALVEHPYKTLIDLCKRGFETVDRFVLSLDPEFKDSDERRELAYEWVLRRNELEGSTKLNANVMGMCVQEYDDILTKNMKDIIVNSDRFHYNDKNKYVALQDTYEKEFFIYNFIMDRLQPKFNDRMPYEEFRTVDGFDLTDEQLGGLKNGSQYGVSIIIGGAGTGKTSAFKGLINMFEQCGKSYCIVAPTGKASLRVTELTNRPASTIHRKVLKDGGVNTSSVFIDESSMVDLDTMYMLLKSIENPNTKLIVCGDNGQLPPVGKGNIFHDMIRSEVIPTTKLTKVFRYADKGIAYVATNINNKTVFLNEKKTHILSDKYKFIQTDDCVSVLLEEYSKLVCNGVKPIEIMCLSPVKKGEDGVYNLNKEIQRMVNPYCQGDKHIEIEIDKTKMDFRIKDVVVCKKNYYDVSLYDTYLACKENDELMLEDFDTTEVFNGQTGIVRDINSDGLVIQFGNEVVFFDKPKAYTLLLGYVITRHSSQGSECPYVISITSKHHVGQYMTKQSCYVSSTRSSDLHIEIGDIEAFNQAILVDSNDLRETYLYDMLKGE